MAWNQTTSMLWTFAGQGYQIWKVISYEVQALYYTHMYVCITVEKDLQGHLAQLDRQKSFIQNRGGFQVDNCTAFIK